MIFQRDVVTSDFGWEQDTGPSSAISWETLLNVKMPKSYANPELFDIFPVLPKRQFEFVFFPNFYFQGGWLVGCVGFDSNYFTMNKEMSCIEDYKTRFSPQFDGGGVYFGITISVEGFNRLEGTARNLGNGAFEIELDGKENLLSFSYLSKGWLMVAYIDMDEVLLPAYEHARSIWFILLIVLTYSLTTPILKIIDCFRAAVEGKLETRIAAHAHDELDYLTDIFNQFMEKIQQLISDLKVQKIDLFLAIAKAEESDPLKTQFPGKLSQELRTPLYAIVGFSQLLDDTNLNEDTRRLYLERINQNNDRLLTFVEDIMIFSKLQLNQLAVNKQKFLFAGLLKEIESRDIDFFDAQVKQIELIVRKRFAGFSLKICSGGIFLKKIITAMLGIACKFSNGGVVILSCDVAHSSYRIYVENEGAGIPLQYQPMVLVNSFNTNPWKNWFMVDLAWDRPLPAGLWYCCLE